MKIDKLKSMARIRIDQRPTKTKALNALSNILESLPVDYEYVSDDLRLVYNYIANVGPAISSIKCPFKYGQKFIDKINIDFRDVFVLDGYLYATDEHKFFKYKIDRENGYYDKNDVRLRDVNETGKALAKTINQIVNDVLISDNIKSNIDYEFIFNEKCVKYPWHNDNPSKTWGIYEYKDIKKLKQFKKLGGTHYFCSERNLLLVGDNDCMVGIMPISEYYYSKMSNR